MTRTETWIEGFLNVVLTPFPIDIELPIGFEERWRDTIDHFYSKIFRQKISKFTLPDGSIMEVHQRSGKKSYLVELPKESTQNNLLEVTERTRIHTHGRGYTPLAQYSAALNLLPTGCRVVESK